MVCSFDRDPAAKTRSKRRSSFLFSCFGGGPAPESDGPSVSVTGSERKKSPGFSWSRFRATKKTVPVDAAGDQVGPVVVSPKREGFFRKFRKGKKTCSKIRTKSPHQFQKQQPKTTNSPSPFIIHSCQPRTRPAPEKPAAPADVALQNGTRTISTSAANSQRPQIKKKCSTGVVGIVGVLTLALALGAMLLGGRVCAILCLSAWFYVLPYLNTATVAAATPTAKMVSYERKMRSIETDKEAAEYKKMVVLKGLLERDRRRPPSRWQKTY